MIKLESYGHMGRWLVARGWEVRPDPTISLGTARVNWRAKAIEVRPKAFDYPTARITLYVMPHELFHAVAAENGTLFDHVTIRGRVFVPRVGCEIVADAGSLFFFPHKQTSKWVRASTLWHSRIGTRYTFADVRSEDARRLALALWTNTKEAGDETS